MNIKKKILIFLFINFFCFVTMSFSHINAEEYTYRNNLNELSEVNYLNYSYRYSDGCVIGNKSKCNHHDDICLLDENEDKFHNILDSYTERYKDKNTGETKERDKISVIRFVIIIGIKNITSTYMSVIVSMKYNDIEWNDVGMNSFKVDKSGYYHIPIYYQFSRFEDISNEVRIKYESNDGCCIINDCVITSRYYKKISNTKKQAEYLPIINTNIFD